MTSCTVLLVCDGQQRGTLAAARSLGAAGHRVLVASTRRGHAARSRFVEAWCEVPPPGPDLVAAVARVVAERLVDAVFAGTDEHLVLLSEGRDQLGAAFPYPTHDVVLGALDKVRLYESARQVGLAVPAFRSSPPDPDDGRQWVAKQRLYAPGSVHACYPADELPPGVHGELVYQECIEEGWLAAVVVFREPTGRLSYLGGQRAERLFPEPNGISVRAGVVDVPTETASGVTRLLEHMGWWGIAELQFLVPPDGTWHLIDFNGRYFGSLALTVAAGADLPNAWLSAAMDLPVRLPRGPRPDVHYQWLEGDLRRSTARSRGRRREVLQSLRYAVGSTHSIWDRRDPAPALLHARDLVLRAVRKARPT